MMACHPQKKAPWRKLHILCVEGDPADRLAMQDYAWILGWEIDVVVRGSDALSSAAVRRYDIIFLDNDMPDLTGFEIVEHLSRTDGPNSNTPIVLNSRSISSNVIEGGKALGVDYFERKPLLLSGVKFLASRLVKF